MYFRRMHRTIINLIGIVVIVYLIFQILEM